jgi:hypothetical protein
MSHRGRDARGREDASKANAARRRRPMLGILCDFGEAAV